MKVSKIKLKSSIFNGLILSILIFLQLTVPIISLACSDVFAITAKNNQNCGIAENNAVQSCCTDGNLPVQRLHSQATKKPSATPPCCEESSNTCSLFCCSTAFVLTSYLPETNFSTASSMLSLTSAFYTSLDLREVYRPPRT